MTAASVIVTALLAAACTSSGPGEAANIDLGSGPPQAGTVKADALKGVTLTFVSYGGIYQEGQTKAAVDPFATESGARILQDGPTDNAKIKAQVDSGNVTWDVIDSTNVSPRSTAGNCSCRSTQASSTSARSRQAPRPTNAPSLQCNTD